MHLACLRAVHSVEATESERCVTKGRLPWTCPSGGVGVKEHLQMLGCVTGLSGHLFPIAYRCGVLTRWSR